MDFTVTKIDVSVKLTRQQWDNLDELDYTDIVVPALEVFGAFDIDYNGHFGSQIMFRCDNVGQAATIANAIEIMLK